MKSLEVFNNGFESLQQRFSNEIVVARSSSDKRVIKPTDLDGSNLDGGFVDISAKPQDLLPFYGRVVLLMNRSKANFNPAVITNRAGTIQITRMDLPFDPNVGITSGILFGLGIKNETASTSFGAHGYGSLESGHLTPAILGVADSLTRQSIIANGDRGSHAVLDDPLSGAPEKMIKSGLLNGIELDTRVLPASSDSLIPIYWHKSLESEDGLQIAEYPDSVKLMLGSATLALGSEAVDRVVESLLRMQAGVHNRMEMLQEQNLYYDPFAENGSELFDPIEAFKLVRENYENNQVEHDNSADLFVQRAESIMLDAVSLDRFDAVSAIVSHMHEMCGQNANLKNQIDSNPYFKKHTEDDGHGHGGLEKSHSHEEDEEDEEDSKFKKKRKNKK